MTKQCEEDELILKVEILQIQFKLSQQGKKIKAQLGREDKRYLLYGPIIVSRNPVATYLVLTKTKTHKTSHIASSKEPPLRKIFKEIYIIFIEVEKVTKNVEHYTNLGQIITIRKKNEGLTVTRS